MREAASERSVFETTDAFLTLTNRDHMSDQVQVKCIAKLRGFTFCTLEMVMPTTLHMTQSKPEHVLCTNK